MNFCEQSVYTEEAYYICTDNANSNKCYHYHKILVYNNIKLNLYVSPESLRALSSGHSFVM